MDSSHSRKDTDSGGFWLVMFHVNSPGYLNLIHQDLLDSLSCTSTYASHLSSTLPRVYIRNSVQGVCKGSNLWSIGFGWVRTQVETMPMQVLGRCHLAVSLSLSAHVILQLMQQMMMLSVGWDTHCWDCGALLLLPSEALDYSTSLAASCSRCRNSTCG